MENSDSTSSLKDYLEIVWLDSHISEHGQHDYMKSRCRDISQLISKWHFFDSSDQLNNYLPEHPNIQLITIMSGRFARQLLALLSPMNNFHSAYVHTINIDRTEEALGEEPKLKGVFNDEEVLLKQLQKDLSELFWNEGKRLAAASRDQEGGVYFAESYRLAIQ